MNTDSDEESEGDAGDRDRANVRIDKWLWAARFFKTRSLATDAVSGGRVQINQQRVKAAKGVRVGDIVEIVAGEERRALVVRALAERRGSAQAAAALYAETADSLQKREDARERRRLFDVPGADLRGRPTKRDRRAIDRFRRG
jgi:ribosome-associated heat shock protein Hsp15